MTLFGKPRLPAGGLDTSALERRLDAIEAAVVRLGDEARALNDAIAWMKHPAATGQADEAI